MSLDAADRAVAARFGVDQASGTLIDPRIRPAHTYTVDAPPEAILAVVDEIENDGRGEAEVVVDPRLLPRVRRAGNRTATTLEERAAVDEILARIPQAVR
jgi:hypothetical protein